MLDIMWKLSGFQCWYTGWYDLSWKHLIHLHSMVDSTEKRTSILLPLLQNLSHCCQSWHYSFTIKKRGQHACMICKPVRIPLENFEKLSFLPEGGGGQLSWRWEIPVRPPPSPICIQPWKYTLLQQALVHHRICSCSRGWSLIVQVTDSLGLFMYG